jgi:hypothetical protein
MADTYGKLYFSWVQCFHLTIPDPTSISANSTTPALSLWPLALSQTNPKTNPKAIRGLSRSFAAHSRVRAEIGGGR